MLIKLRNFAGKSEGKGGDETADDINVEMRNDADVEAGEYSDVIYPFCKTNLFDSKLYGNYL